MVAQTSHNICIMYFLSFLPFWQSLKIYDHENRDFLPDSCIKIVSPQINKS